MKYQVSYRLKHPEYMPTTSRTVIDACSHAELETRLVKIMAKWQARGYTVQITRISQSVPMGDDKVGKRGAGAISFPTKTPDG
jgi:hypothetical protein